MGYLGNTPALSYTSFAVQHFTTSATTSYTLDYSVANENEIRLVINNVVQQPGSSYAYTASGTTLTLSAATSATDTMYAVFLGKAVQTVTPASGSVTNAMLGETITVANGGTGLTSGFANGITVADQWRLTANTNSGTDADVTTNWERNDTTGYGKIGTGLTESSGIFSFPTTGVYLIICSPMLELGSGDNFVNVNVRLTTDNSTYTDAIVFKLGNRPTSGDDRNAPSNNFIFNVTNITNDKFKFETSSFGSGTVLLGASDSNRTSVTAIRLGDSV